MAPNPGFWFTAGQTNGTVSGHKDEDVVPVLYSPNPEHNSGIQLKRLFYSSLVSCTYLFVSDGITREKLADHKDRHCMALRLTYTNRSSYVGLLEF